MELEFVWNGLNSANILSNNDDKHMVPPTLFVVLTFNQIFRIKVWENLIYDLLRWILSFI